MRASCFRRSHTAWQLSCVVVLLTLVHVVHVSPATARTWYILPDGTGDAATIQAGVDSAAAGDIVLVAPGTYSNTHSILLDGTPTDVIVAISKNIRLMSEHGPDITTIGSPEADVVVYMEGVDSSAEVIGFRIRTVFEPFGCVDVPVRSSPPLVYLIGIKCKDSFPRIVGNVFTENGIAVELNASPAFFSENSVDLAFYGVICNDGSDANIVDNVFHFCAEMVRSIGSGPQVVRNDMYEGCSAVYSVAGSSGLVAENRIHNISPIAVDCGDSEIVIENNQFFDNNLVVRLTGITGTTVVRGNTFYNQVSGAVSLSDNPGADITIENNTIDRSTDQFAIFCQAASSPVIRNNIILRSIGGIACVAQSFPTFVCNNVFLTENQRYGGECTDQTGMNGNIAVDPQFCGVVDSGNYHLQADSPCAPGNHPEGGDCGLIGAVGVGCGAVPTRTVTWGSIKAIYGEERK
jgi:Periplasmic copper-binding protein (NosD)